MPKSAPAALASTGTQAVQTSARWARTVCYIPMTAFVEGHGWRVSFVIEGEDGHHPTGDWPYEAKLGQKMPWFWGHPDAPTEKSYETAVTAANEYNARLGISVEEAQKIVADSIEKSLRGRKGHRRGGRRNGDAS